MNSRWVKIKGPTKAKAFSALALVLMLFNYASDAGQFLWPEETDSSVLPYAGQLSKRADAEIKSSRKSRPSKIAPPASRPAPAIADDDDEADEKPTGKFCATCQHDKKRAGEIARIPGKKIAKLDAETGAGTGKLSAAEICYSNAIFEAAKTRTKRAYGNRDHSKGACAVGVRGHLGFAGVYNGQSLGEGAIDYASSGKLAAQGLRNRLSEFPTPESAPKGAVLVFAGPASSQYITNRTKIYSGGCHINKRGKRVCKGAGNWAGHITIAGEKNGKGRWYYTDGRTPQPAVRNRRLVGVFIMNQCGPNCSSALRNRCGG